MEFWHHCFPMYSATHDRGTIEKHKFVVPQLDEMKKSCQTHCFSTLNHNLGFCYNDARAINWVLKQAAHGFQGVTGSFVYFAVALFSKLARRTECSSDARHENAIAARYYQRVEV